MVQNFTNHHLTESLYIFHGFLLNWYEGFVNMTSKNQEKYRAESERIIEICGKFDKIFNVKDCDHGEQKKQIIAITGIFLLK